MRFFNFFFDIKKPTFTGKSEIPSFNFTKAAMFPDENLVLSERISSKLLKPRMISFLPNVYIFFFNVSSGKLNELPCKFVTYCKFFSAFGSASCQHLPAVFRFHSFPETVLIFPFCVARLISSFQFLMFLVKN